MTSPAPFHSHLDDKALRLRLLALARRWSAADHDAEDLVQETYLRTAHGALSDTENPEAWMVTVLRNLCIDGLRRHDRYRSILANLVAGSTGGTEADTPEHRLDTDQQVTMALLRLVRSLSPGDVALLLLHEVFELDHARLGELSGRSEVASRQHVRRLLARVRGDRQTWDDAYADEDTGDLLALCQLAVCQRDPAGLIATVRISSPMALMSLAEPITVL
ncbi:MAG: putative RNA polymerase sigma factor SigI [Luteibacter sp.]|uniref:sigma-70 family RNA polymerase sigma factor n=1 Tax=Luteibacter sp. TaxID=1886636 RepID=UPI00137F30A8|nr:sigma-70 family RNA polymerase sigma factor [Luteibacter sp.]KAF1006854.1 MAG: putative RNA polymerase sigma factor SigI [Luteibacter sp.]